MHLDVATLLGIFCMSESFAEELNYQYIIDSESCYIVSLATSSGAIIIGDSLIYTFKELSLYYQINPYKASLNKSAYMSLKIYNLLGELVQVVDKRYRQVGEYTDEIDMGNFASGIYSCTLRQEANSLTKKFVLEK